MGSRLGACCRCHLGAMRVEAAKRAEKNLPPHTELVSHADKLGYLFQLIAEARARIQWKRRDGRITSSCGRSTC